MRTLAICLAAALLVSTALAYADPPPGMPLDPEIHAWFESLERVDGFRCCSEADCKVASPGELRISRSGYQVLVDGAWRDVPDEMIVHREDNPLGATIICEARWALSPKPVYCVVPWSAG